ncbi:hypothetical protein [Microbacterium sp. WCS2018Hpa-9]|uniref:flagellar hook-length control protein FliK n=1 Tax=Microbacterium sp. WCS2018Hpa-9 TaxID=3073635 RepID=UPI00288962CD|nr:hypothetical protein [Microbacterium sp. WCS2018Hpa-9]
MTAVGLLATMPGAGSGEADTGGRASADSGSLFGDALTAAGRTLDRATDSGTAKPATAEQSGPTVEASAAPDRAIDPQAAIAAMTHLVAWSAPVTAELSATTPQTTTPQATTSETAGPKAPTPQATSETTLPSATAPDTTGETMPGKAGAEASSVDEASGATETDAVTTVPSDTVPATHMTSASATATAPASAPASSPASAPAAASAAVAAGGRGELRTSQGRPGDPRGVVDVTATPQDPASGGAEPALSDPVAAVIRPEPFPRQSPPAIPSVVGIPVPAPGVGGPLEQQMASDAGDQPQGSQPVPATAPIAPVAPGPTVAPASSPDGASAANRSVAAQVAPVIVSIAQRPMGTHQLTMTVNPDSLGPVTVRAHITASGEVQVELSGATDAGRDALRTMLVELRRDLAAVMPHATLSVNHGASADSSGDRGQQAAGDAPPQQGAGDRDENRGRPDHRRGVEQAPDLPRTIQTTPSAISGAGLDIFA